AQQMVLRDSVAIVERRSVNEQCARLAQLGGLLQPLETLRLVSILEQQQPQRRLGVEMPACGSTLEPGLRCREVDRNAAPEAVGLAEIEMRIGIALFGERAPD